MKITTVYFSATYTTHRIVSHLAKRLSEEVIECDITNDTPTKEIVIPKDEVLVVGIPVYAGRVPDKFIYGLKLGSTYFNFRGDE